MRHALGFFARPSASPRRSLRSLLILLVALTGCGGTELDDVDCPDGGTTLTYESFGKPFVEAWCQGCHASSIEDRQGAPPSYVFDTRDQMLHHKERIFSRAAADNDSMPPGPDDPSPEQREQLAEWLACGAP